MTQSRNRSSIVASFKFDWSGWKCSHWWAFVPMVVNLLIPWRQGILDKPTAVQVRRCGVKSVLLDPLVATGPAVTCYSGVEQHLNTNRGLIGATKPSGIG